jgi:zinc transporter ZupT
MPVLLSGLAVFVLPVQKPKRIRLLLSFSGAYLLALSVLHFLPEIYQSSGSKAGLFVLLGFLMQLGLEIISGGIEHGHIHVHKKDNQKAVIPYGVIIGLGIHSFLEGMPLAFNQDAEINQKFPLLIGIIFHKIPVAIVLMSLLIQVGVGKQKAFMWLIMFALVAPIGTLVGYFIGGNLAHEAHHFSDYILGIVVGIFLHVSTTILFEASDGHRFNRAKFMTVILGILLAILNM